MPFYPPFNFPFFYNNYRYSRNPLEVNKDIPKKELFKEIDNNQKKASASTDTPEAFFEIFGLKLYFDDILIICILFLLYTEKVQDEELFICLILLLLT